MNRVANVGDDVERDESIKIYSVSR